ncbi:ATP-binding protein [Actinokineospora sp. NPDC004072]
MPEPQVRNEVAGSAGGPVVQAGVIHNLTLANDPLPVPRQLPMAAPDFVGRHDQLAALDGMVRSASRTVVVTAVDGLPGVGKTALALFWAHQVQDRYADGTFYADLRGYGPGKQATPNEVLDGFIRSLGVRPERIPVDAGARAALYRSLMADRQMLVVLDNANSAEQVRPLLPGGSASAVLVTSRDSLTGLVVGERARRLTLRPLPPEDAVHLLGTAIGPHRAATEEAAVRALARQCGSLPLALRIAGSRIAMRPGTSVAAVVGEMEGDRLAALSASSDEASAVRAVFGWSYRKLTEEQAALFRRLGLHPGGTFGPHAAAAVSCSPILRARNLLDELVEVNLLEAEGDGRYRFHDLLRAYAVERVNQDDSAHVRDQGVRAVLRWYAYMAATADHELYPAYVHRFHDLDRPPTAVIPVRGRVEALSWLAGERLNVLAALRHASESDRCASAVSLVHAVETYLYHHAFWDELFEALSLGITAAERIGDRASRAWFLNRSGWARLQVGEWEDAVGELRTALTAARELGDPYLEAYARNDIGMACLRRGRHREALRILLPAVALSRGTDGGRQRAFVHCNLSSAYAGLGEHRNALEHARRSLVLRRDAGDSEGEVFTLNQLATVWLALGDHSRAIAVCEEALAIPRDYVYLPDVAATLETLGWAHRRNGDPNRARACWAKALAIYDDFRDHRAPGLRLAIGERAAED